MSVAKFTEALKSLMPRGFTWNIAEGTNLDLFLKSFAAECNRIADKALALIEEADPRTTSDLISDFERVLGIINTSSDIAVRRLAVQDKLQTLSTIAEADFLTLFQRYVETTGADATIEGAAGPITSYTLARESIFQSGYSHSGDPINGEQWSHFVWIDIDVTTPGAGGLDALLESLSVYATTLLQAHELAYPRLI